MKSRIRLVHRIGLVFVILVLLLCLTACQESMSSKYERANKLLTEGKYTEAAAIFDEISTYEDASKMSLYTKAINAAETGDYETAFSTFESLGEFKDCPMMITYYKGRQYEASVYNGAWIYGSNWFDAIDTYESIPLFRDSKDRAESCRKAAYDQAVKSGDEGNTSFAISILKELGSYSDAAKQVTYYQAVALLNQSDYSGSSRTFGSISGFRDADSRATGVLEDGYMAAAAKEEAGELDEANAIFLNLGVYKDSAERAYKLYYDAGMTRREAGDWDGARAVFSKAGAYSDAAEQIKETTYQEASALEEAGYQEGAYELFIGLGEYKDSYERANKPYYDLGVQKMNAGEWLSAATAFSHAGEYNDAVDQMRAAYYLQGEALRKAEDWDAARAAFEHAGTYSDAVEQIKETTYQEAASAYVAGEFEKAYYIYGGIKGYKDVDRLLKEDENIVAVRKAPYREVGRVVTFGTYPQIEETDRWPIEWIVLDYDEVNRKALLLSLYGLDSIPYNKKLTNITWEQCTVRAWLNDEFLNKAFSAKEQSAILVTNVDNSSSQGYSKWNTVGGNNTQDRLFLLSYAEANRYLGIQYWEYDDGNNIKSRVAPTPYAMDHEAWTGSNQTENDMLAGWWWLRSPGDSQSNAARVLDDGSLDCYFVDISRGVIRPAFWLNLDSDIF